VDIAYHPHAHHVGGTTWLPDSLILDVLGPNTVISHGKTPKRLSTFSLPFTFPSDAETLARLPLPPKIRSRSGSAEEHTRFISLIRPSNRTSIPRGFEGQDRNRLYNSDLISLSYDARRHSTTSPVSDILDLVRLPIRISARCFYTSLTHHTSGPTRASTISDLPIDQKSGSPTSAKLALAQIPRLARVSNVRPILSSSWRTTRTI
jgi:hypothetical protein